MNSSIRIGFLYVFYTLLTAIYQIITWAVILNIISTWTILRLLRSLREPSLAKFGSLYRRLRQKNQTNLHYEYKYPSLQVRDLKFRARGLTLVTQRCPVANEWNLIKKITYRTK